MLLDYCQRYVFKIQLDKNEPVNDIDIQGIKFGLGVVGPCSFFGDKSNQFCKHFIESKITGCDYSLHSLNVFAP